MTSMIYLDELGGGGDGLLGVQLDDELLSHGHIDLLAEGELAHGDRLAAVAGVEPGREAHVERVEVVLDDDHRLALGPEGDDVALLDPEARDVDPATVDVDQPVVHELASLRPGAGPAGPEDDVVEALLEEAEQVLTRDALGAGGLLVEVLELALEQAVDVLGLLLLLELHRVLGGLTPAGATVLAGRVRPLLEGLAALLVLEDVDAEAPADLDLGSGVASHREPQTRRRLGGRQPLWGTGVTSLMPVTSMPVAWSDRMAVSRPDPGPLTCTSTFRTPC